jgi:hypothetical protein
MTQGAQGGDAPVPGLPQVRAQPVPPGDSFYEQLAAPLTPTEVGKETVAEREARRLRALMPEGYEPESAAELTFDPRIAYALALGVSTPSKVFEKYGVSLENAKRLIATPHFIATVKRYKEELLEKGVTFRLKAKIQAEDLLTHSYVLATDPEVPPAVRADLIKWTAKMAGLEPSDREKGGGGGAGSGFNLYITFAGGAPTPTLVGGHTVEGEFKRVEDNA